MTKDQMQKELDVLQEEYSLMEDKVENLETRNGSLKKEVYALESQMNQLSIIRTYLEGQLEVLKRVSGLYPEIFPTRDEYLRAYKDVISTSADWRSVIPEDDCPF